MIFKTKSKNSKLKLAGLALISAPLLLTSCFEESDEIINGNGLIPGIISFEPDTAEPGQQVTITGSNLETTNTVLFNEESAEIVSTSGNSVIVIVPETATTGVIRIGTENGLNEFRENFKVFLKDAPVINKIEPELVQAGERVTLTGTKLNAVSAINIGGVETTDLTISATELSFTVGEGTPLGTTAMNITSSVGVTSTDVKKTPLLIAGTIDSLVETFDNNENLLSHGFDAEVSFNGLNNDIAEEAPFVPEKPIDGAFYYIGGTSDTSDSSDYTGLIGSSERPSDTYSIFFNENPNVKEIYFNLDINFGDIPSDEEDLAGIRLRFDEGYDLDNDGKTSDEYMEYRPTVNDLAEKGFVPNEDGWYSISIRLDEFLNSGPKGNVGTWDEYDIKKLTRIAVSSRREYNGLYSMSIDNVSISVGIPVNERITAGDNN